MQFLIFFISIVAFHAFHINIGYLVRDRAAFEPVGSFFDAAGINDGGVDIPFVFVDQPIGFC